MDTKTREMIREKVQIEIVPRFKGISYSSFINANNAFVGTPYVYMFGHERYNGGRHMYERHAHERNRVSYLAIASNKWMVPIVTFNPNKATIDIYKPIATDDEMDAFMKVVLEDITYFVNKSSLFEHVETHDSTLTNSNIIWE